jgi:Putative peptidoglycan binding domain
MAVTYTVLQGDHISKIAKAFGFSDYQTIWNDPHNAELKQTRQNPNVLLPGDSIYIPDRQLREESRSTDQRHSFVKKISKLRLRVTLVDQYEKPISNAACTLVLGAQSRQITSDASGQIDEDIEPDVHDAILVIQDQKPQTPFNNVQLPLKIGDLDPVTAISGQAARLTNMGYFDGDVDQPDPKAFKSAVEEFQCDYGLIVDGICGPKTQATLKKVHGC